MNETINFVKHSRHFIPVRTFSPSWGLGLTCLGSTTATLGGGGVGLRMVAFGCCLGAVDLGATVAIFAFFFTGVGVGGGAISSSSILQVGK